MSADQADAGATVADPTMKRCSRCEQTKPRGEFFRNSAQADGLQSWCKVCRDEHRQIDKVRAAFVRRIGAEDSPLLSADELTILAGSARPIAQVKWLTQNGIAFEFSDSGALRVERERVGAR